MRVCGTGGCGGPTLVREDGSDIVRALVQSGDLPGPDAPCCAYCAGVALDPTIPPETPAALLRRGRGCPLSIIAYRAALEARKGHSVEIEDRPGLTPELFVDGETVNPLSDYRTSACGCEGT